MKVVLLRVGRGKTPWADEAVQDFGKRLGRKIDFEEKLLSPTRFKGDVASVRNDEATRILKQIKKGDRLIAVDERGQTPDSEAFSKWLDQAAQASTRRLVFAIGGPYGHGKAVRDASWKVLSLSSMVVNHELARVILVEQLYRASTLLWGGSYHH